MGPALTNPDLADGCSADPAGCALATVDADDKAAGLEDAVDIGAPGSNRLTQDSYDCRVQPAYLVRQ